MGKLIALKPILYKGKQYIPGEEIPGDDAEKVEAWKRAESVEEQIEEIPCDVATMTDDLNPEHEENAQPDITDVDLPVESPKEGKRKK